MHLLIGLGNPGPQYANTRHNAGFLAIDRFAKKHAGALPQWRNKFGGETCELNIGPALSTSRVLLLKPMRFMNCSGNSVAEALAFYKIDRAHMLVLVDDYALPLGTIRIRESGGHGGHNGLRDIDRALGDQNYPRLRIGIDPPPPTYNDPAQWVLGTFTEGDLTNLSPGLDRTTDAATTFITHGLTKAMNTYNAKK